ncbi:MAG TPA: acyltransferase [Usitatibacter sp.]|nr:acyltransferase [Usitatibacter sp.]
MPVTSLLFPAIVTILCLVVCEAIASGTPWYREHLGSLARGHFHSVDGLRGFLAIAVFFAHVVATWRSYAGVSSYSPFPPVHATLGQAGVALFFMITAFLFWRRVLRSKDAFDARALYVSRLRRLVPMYALSVALVVIVVAALTGFAPQEPPLTILKELRAWLSFGFMSGQDLNGVKDAHFINPVYWTLAYEWTFYLALPLLALFARGALFWFLVAAAVFFGIQAPLTLCFVCGVLAATAVESRLLEGRLAKWWLAPVPLAAVAAVPAGFDTAYHPAPIALLFVAFLFVVDGNTIFGLLRTRAAQLFGAVSYSFYLLHCIVLYVVFRIVDGAFPVAELTGGQHWAVAATAALLALSLSAFTYRHLEYPFIAKRDAAPADPVPAPAAVARVPVA